MSRSVRCAFGGTPFSGAPASPTTFPMFTSDKTVEPVKSSSEGRHLNYLREIFGHDAVSYEPASFKVLNRPASMGGHMVSYTPDFLIAANGRHAFVESKSDMTAVDMNAIAKAAGVKKAELSALFEWVKAGWEWHKESFEVLDLV